MASLRAAAGRSGRRGPGRAFRAPPAARSASRGGWWSC